MATRHSYLCSDSAAVHGPTNRPFGYAEGFGVGSDDDRDGQSFHQSRPPIANRYRQHFHCAGDV